MAQAQHLWDKSYPDGLTWNDPVAETTMVRMFDESVKKYGDRPCLSFKGRSWTYAEVGKMVDRFAKGLQDKGFGKGARVGLCLPNTPFYIVAYYGALKAGATLANFDPTAPADALAEQIDDSKTDVLVAINLLGDKKQPLYPSVEAALKRSSLQSVIVCDMAEALPPAQGIAYRVINKVADSKAPFFNKVARDLRDKKGIKPTAAVPKDDEHFTFRELMKSRGRVVPAKVRPADTALLQYTGGTTGVPKGAELTHANLTANTRQCQMWFNAGRAESGVQQKVVAVLPFFHVFSMTTMMNLSLAQGSEIIIMPQPDTNELLHIIDRQKPTILAGVPLIYDRLLAHKDLKNFDLSSLEICISGGAALPETTLAAWQKLTGKGLLEGYGLSETSPLAAANPLTGVKKQGSVGLPVPGMEVKFTDIDDPEKALPLGQEGEICFKGPQVMKGYFGRPDETAKVFDKDGWFHTGDVGYMDKDGYIFITDRIKDMIINNGFKAFPRKIEDAIRAYPGVGEVLVIGNKLPNGNEVPVAFIERKKGAEIDPKQLVEFLQKHLKPYELPRAESIYFDDELPRTKIGKPDKKALRARFAASKAAAAPKP